MTAMVGPTRVRWGNVIGSPDLPECQPYADGKPFQALDDVLGANAPPMANATPKSRAAVLSDPHNDRTAFRSLATVPQDDMIRVLGPPLAILPQDIRPDELMAYRADYQAFRAGHAVGARGELNQLCDEDPRRKDSSSSGGAADTATPGSGAGGSVNLASARASPTEDEDSRVEEAYYSEPDREGPSSVPSARLEATGRAAKHAAQPRDTAAREAASGPSSASRLVRLPAGAKTLGQGAESVRSPARSELPSPTLLDFDTWLADEVQSRPDEEQLPRLPRSHLLEVVSVPFALEKVLGFGFLLCLDIMLHELSFTPVQALRAAVARHLRCRSRRRLTITEQCDLTRLALLMLNVGLVVACWDASRVYHYIRGESFLKLYVIFNMLEMFERWIRSVGVDLFDLVFGSVRHSWGSLLPKFLAALAYCFVHSYMHLLRVLLLNVAINTSSSAVFLILVTNNFGEIKSTVFKRYEAKSLFPIITSDIVERFYLIWDIVFVLLRLAISPNRGMNRTQDITWWIFLLIVIELGTDWIKFCLIVKFSEMQACTLEIYREVLIADILLSRSGHVGHQRDAGSSGVFAAGSPAGAVGAVQGAPAGGAAALGAKKGSAAPAHHHSIGTGASAGKPGATTSSFCAGGGATAGRRHAAPATAAAAVAAMVSGGPQATAAAAAAAAATGGGGGGGEAAGAARGGGGGGGGGNASPPFRGITSFSHAPARRIGFSGVPMTTLVVVHLLMLIQAPCTSVLQHPQAIRALFLVVAFALISLAKVLLGICVLGFAARRRHLTSKGLELFTKIKAL